jgi:hypothetical protein
MVFCRKSMPSTSSDMINIKFHTSVKLMIRYGYTYMKRESWSLAANMKLRPLQYGHYTITKVVGESAFELSIPLFHGLHSIFNVELLQPYFPPLLDTTEVVEHLVPTKLNLDYDEQGYDQPNHGHQDEGHVPIDSLNAIGWSKQGHFFTKVSGSLGTGFN